jgi:C1A family cysteine protease
MAMDRKRRSKRAAPTKPDELTTLSLSDIEAAATDANYSWQAGPTPLSSATIAEQRAHLGLIVNETELAATAAAVAAAETFASFRTSVAAPPAAIDWRANAGNWVTSIKDQSNCGSCVAFGTVATIESRIRIACKNANLAVDLAEAQLFYCGCGNCCANGWNFSPALDFAKNTGLVVESAFPYTPGNQACKQGLPQPYIKLTAWSPVLSTFDRKNILSSKGPMVAGMQVFQDFYSYRSGVYRHVTGASAGYHAISVVGYDDVQGCWICKNSWGPGWGEAGFFRIAYGQCSIDTQFPFYDVDLTCPPTPVRGCDIYMPELRRILTAARTNHHLRMCLRFYVCNRGPIPIWCPPTYRQLAQKVASILRLCPREKVWFCRVLG